MGNKTQNLKTQNLLRISFLLSFIGCVHAMRIEGTSPARVIENTQRAMLLPEAPIEHFQLPADMSGFFERLAEANKEGDNGFRAFELVTRIGFKRSSEELRNDGFESATTIGFRLSLSRLKEEGFGKSEIVLYGFHPDVLWRITNCFSSEDLHDFLLDVAEVFGWDGFVRINTISLPIAALSNRVDLPLDQHYELMLDFVSKVPADQLMRIHDIEKYLLEKLLLNVNTRDRMKEILGNVPEEQRKVIRFFD